jgi:hypothetical protein
MTIPKRFLEITTGKGPMDAAYLAALQEQYAKAIRGLAAPAPVCPPGAGAMIPLDNKRWEHNRPIKGEMI